MLRGSKSNILRGPQTLIPSVLAYYRPSWSNTIVLSTASNLSQISFLWTVTKCGSFSSHYRTLFAPERNQWIDARCTARRNEAGDRGHRHKDDGHRGDGWNVVRHEAIEQCCHEACREHCQSRTDRQSSERQQQTASAKSK